MVDPQGFFAENDIQSQRALLAPKNARKPDTSNSRYFGIMPLFLAVIVIWYP
jgi:hypothetical protein